MTLYSLRTKVLLTIGCGFLVATLSIVFLAHTGMQSIIDRSQTVVYGDQVKNLLATLKQYDEELKKTLQVEAYRDQFQEEALRIVRENFLSGADENAYPFILNSQGHILMHPFLPVGDKSPLSQDFIKPLLQTASGNFKYRYQGEDKWLIYSHFEPWDWVVVYSLKQDYMYADLTRFYQTLLPGLIVLLLVVTFVLIYVMRYFLQPIFELKRSARRIADGQLDQPIEIRGRDEVAELASSFEAMRLAVRQNIDTLKNQHLTLENEITVRQQAEKKALKSEAQLRAVIDSAADPLLVTNPAHEIIMLNSLAQETFPDADVGSQLQDVLGDVTLDEAIAPIVRGEQEHVHVDFSHNQAVPLPRIYSCKSAAISDPDKTLAGVVTLMRDVTELRELERLKSEFISIAAHELSTPLTIIQAYTELLVNSEPTGHSYHEYLATILKRCEELNCLIGDIHDVSKMESGQSLHLTMQEFDLGEHVERLVGQYREGTSEHQFLTRIPDSALMVSADGGKIQRVLENLLSNAIKFSPLNSRIEVAAEQRGASVWVTVTDHGVGIPAEKQGRIFEKFYRVDGSDTAPRGLGLGLHIVKSIIEAHRGEIRLESRPGQGTTFSFRLPLSGSSYGLH